MAFSKAWRASEVEAGHSGFYGHHQRSSHHLRRSKKKKKLVFVECGELAESASHGARNR